MQPINTLIRNAALGLIRLYQHTLSPDHGWYRHRHPYGFCRYTPSCSEYAYQAIQHHGVLRGFGKAVWRVLKCTPLSPGGYDPVIKTHA